MITFLHPWALAGFAAVAVPIAIHLIRERRRIVTVPSLLLFTNMKKITSRRKLEELFLLILRCLEILLIVLLLAVPCVRRPADVSGAGGEGTGITLGILLDDSPLSETTLQGRRAFDLMKENALKRVCSLSPDSVVLIASAAAGSVSAPLTPETAEKILRAMETLPQRGNLVRAVLELERALRAIKGTFYATVLIEAQPFAETWRAFRADAIGLPLSMFHTDALLMDNLPDPFIESARMAGRTGEIEITLGGDCMPLPSGTTVECRSPDSNAKQVLALPTGLQLKNTVVVKPSGFQSEDALLLALQVDGNSGGALARWYLPPAGASTMHSSVILLHDGTQETAYPVLTFHAALTLSDTQHSVRALDLRKPGALAELKQLPKCVIIPTLKHLSPALPPILADLLRKGSNLMLFAQKQPLSLPGFSPVIRMQWRDPVRSAAGFNLSVTHDMTVRDLFFPVYAKGLSAVRLAEFSAIIPEAGDIAILHHATMPVLSIRPVDGAGALILWGIPTHPLPLELTALPVFPELLRTAVSFGGRQQAGCLFAGDSVNPAEVLGRASGSVKLRGPGEDENSLSRVFHWTPGQPAELYFAQPGFHYPAFADAGQKTELGILAVNLRRQTGGWLAPDERGRLPQSIAPEEKPKLSTLTGDGAGNLTVTGGELINIPLSTPLILALTAVLLMETFFSMLSSRRRRETEQC